MKSLVVANWKMNPQTLAEAKRLFDSVQRGIKNIKNVEMVICPPFVYLINLQLIGKKWKNGGKMGSTLFFQFKKRKERKKN